MKTRQFDLGTLLEHRLLTRHMIAPVIFRLAESQEHWRLGERDVDVRFRPTLRGKADDTIVRIAWDQGSIALDHEYTGVREDLRKLGISMNEETITELAALGVGFVLVKALLPNDRITRVVPIGGRGDFYLNGRRDQMIEVSGTVRGDLNQRFREKRAQVLLNKSLRKAMVCVSRFATPASRLERVK